MRHNNVLIFSFIYEQEYGVFEKLVNSTEAHAPFIGTNECYNLFPEESFSIYKSESKASYPCLAVDITKD